jgi:4-amino-4-deoxy-L-arabinose transferase-like glycosyltransferase
VKSLAAILMVAFCLRVGYLWDYQRDRSQQGLAVLPFLFEPGHIAVSLATGKGFSSPLGGDTGPTAWLAPVYPLILAAIFRIFGVHTFASFLAAAGLNIVFSTLTVVPIFLVGRRIGGASVGALAAWLWAVFPNAIKLPVESLWDGSLAALLAAIILWATLELADRRDLWEWYAYGLLWGLALMTNPSLGALLPFLVGWLAWRAQRVAWFLMTVAAALLCCLPWMLRNGREFHRFVPLRSAAGLALWLGRFDQSTSSPGRMHPIDNPVERARYVELGEMDYMQEKQAEALQFMTDHPADEARAAWSHFVAIWSGGSPRPLADLVSSNWSVGFILLFNLLSAFGALAGAVVLFRRGSRYWFPLAVVPTVFPLVYYLALGIARYRHPMDPVLLVLTAVALTAANSAWRTSHPSVLRVPTCR